MKRETIDQALARASDTRHLLFGPGAVDGVADTFAATFGNAAAAVVVADETTYGVAGAAVERRLRGARRVVREPLVFPATPRLHAVLEHDVWLGERLVEHDAIPAASSKPATGWSCN